ncbi:unnamed protein product [Cunninghamella blakesleeana]
MSTMNNLIRRINYRYYSTSLKKVTETENIYGLSSVLCAIHSKKRQLKQLYVQNWLELTVFSELYLNAKHLISL